jgi:AraC-like DNA-binding protein
LRAARLLGVRQTINTRLHEPGLSLTDVAKDNAISERYVQRLFEGVDTSFSNYLLEQRLELALRLLTNPLQRHRRISDIATEAGFGDLSHFNRSFRQRFGDTPSGVRSRMTGD